MLWAKIINSLIASFSTVSLPGDRNDLNRAGYQEQSHTTFLLVSFSLPRFDFRNKIGMKVAK